MQATTDDPALEASGLAHGFGDVAVIDELDLRVAAGEVVGLVGPSGCGKSTLLELVAGLLEPTSGSITVDGETDPAGRLERCVLMPQSDSLLPWLTAIDNAALGPRIHRASRADARSAARPLFERFGLAGFEGAAPNQLSGGMRQRVAFLRTLLAGKPLLLLDEPFGSLDAITRIGMQEWLAEALAAEKRTTLLVTHDVEEALYLCDRVLVLSERPARLVTELTSERPRDPERAGAVSEPAFVAARTLALDALRGDAARGPEAEVGADA
jgi:NitT/TauT family transport system ATP-binding protein